MGVRFRVSGLGGPGNGVARQCHNVELRGFLLAGMSRTTSVTASNSHVRVVTHVAGDM